MPTWWKVSSEEFKRDLRTLLAECNQMAEWYDGHPDDRRGENRWPQVLGFRIHELIRKHKVGWLSGDRLTEILVVLIATGETKTAEEVINLFVPPNWFSKMAVCMMVFGYSVLIVSVGISIAMLWRLACHSG